MGRRRKGRQDVEIVSSESGFDEEDEMPLSAVKKRQKKQSVAPARSPKKRRAAARNISYNVDESDESDITEVPEKNVKHESSDYIPSKSADSTEETGVEEIEVDEGSSVQEEEPVTPPNFRKGKATPRSSERIKKKKERKRFSMPSRREVFNQIVDQSPTKSLSEVQPRKLVNNFTKVHNSYNYDPNFTDGESSIEDFIDDEEEIRQKKKKHVRKEERKRRNSRIVRQESSSSESECGEDNVKKHPKMMNRSRIESSESDSDAPVHATRRKKLNSSVILESDSECERMDTKGAECIQIDGADDKKKFNKEMENRSSETTGSSDGIKPTDKGNGSGIVTDTTVCAGAADVMCAGAAGSADKIEPKDNVKNSNSKGETSVQVPNVVHGSTSGPLSVSNNRFGASGSTSCTSKAVVPFNKTGTIRDVELDEDEVNLLVEVDSEDSLEEFILNSDYEDVENVEPDDESENSEEINVSNCHNRQFIASDSESEEEDQDRIRKPSKRVQLMEQKRQAHKDKFNVFRKASRKGS